MIPVVRPLYLVQGATFTWGFTWYHEALPATVPPTMGLPRDLTGCTAQMQIRRERGTDVLVDARSDGPLPMIVLGGSNGHVAITIPGGATEALTVKVAKYDIEVTLAEPLPNGQPDIRRLFKGPAEIDPNITGS